MWSPVISYQARIYHNILAVVQAGKTLQVALQSRSALISWINAYMVKVHWCRSRKAESEQSCQDAMKTRLHCLAV